MCLITLLCFIVLENAKRSKDGISENLVFSRTSLENDSNFSLANNRLASNSGVKIIGKEFLSDKLCLNAIRSVESELKDNVGDFVFDEYTIVETTVPYEMLPKIAWSADCDADVFLLASALVSIG